MTAPRLSYRSEGTFDAGEWLKEGDGLLASARTTRATWLLKKRRFTAVLRSTPRPKRTARAWNELTGLPRASVLLLGYAAEMFLKAGLAKAYHGCREEMYERDVRKRFGHDLGRLAKEVDFPLSKQSQTDFETLRHHILAGARYPAVPKAGQSYVDAVNELTHKIWDRATFRRYCALVGQVRKHVAKLDSDRRNPATFKSLNIDTDGYLVFRVGGNLSTRITYRPSTSMLKRGLTSPRDVRSLLDPNGHRTILHYWDTSIIVEDGWGNGADATVVHQDP
jgi:hypothetical protein